MKLPFTDIFILVIDTAISDVYDKPISRKDYLTFFDMFERHLTRRVDENFDSVEMNATVERQKWGRLMSDKKQIWKFTEIIKTLESKHIIKATGYVVKAHSKRYSYTEAFLNCLHFTTVNFIEEEINDKIYNTLKNSKSYDTSNPQYQLLKSDRFTIDTDRCLELITNTDNALFSKQQIITNLKRIVDINHKDIFTVKIDNGRVYTTFSTLKREFRSFCKIDNKYLVSLDLKSSQPYFLFSYLKDKYPHSIGVKKLYDIITQEDIYNYLITINNQLFDKPIKTREDCKTLVFTYIFKRSNKGNDIIQRIIKDKFPDVYDIINKERIDFVKRGSTLANYLQSLEASIFIPVCEKFANEGCLSVHDSLYFVPEIRVRVESELSSMFKLNQYKDFVLR